MKYILSIALVANLLLFSCTPQYDAIDPNNTFFLGIVQEKEVSLEDFLDYDEIQKYAPNIGEYLDPILGDRVIGITVIKYQTVDPYGQPAVASGVIYYPKNGRIQGVVEIPGIAHLYKDGGPSGNIPSLEGSPALMGYITLTSDLLGYGVSQQYMHPFLLHNNAALVAYHFRKAANEYLQTIGYGVPKKTLIASYSYGASIALAMAKYYQTSHANEIEVERVIVGGGCYEPAVAFDAFAQKATSGYPITPAIVLAMDHYYNLELDYQKIFYGPLAQHYLDWYDGYHGLTFVTNTLGTDMHYYMHPDFFTASKNQEFDKLYRVLRDNSTVANWTPKMPIHFFHATDDDFVPFECALYAYEAFKARGADVSLQTGTGGHSGNGVAFGIAFCAYLALK